MLLIYAILIALSTTYANDSLTDALPEPEGDLQYLLFGLFIFLSFLVYMGAKIYLSTQEKPTPQLTTNESLQLKLDQLTQLDHQLTMDIAENARQIGMLERANEFQALRFEEHKKRTESNVQELFDKIDNMNDRIGTKVDSLMTAIIAQGVRHD